MTEADDRVWWLHTGNEVHGPYTAADLAQRASDQSLTADTLVCQGHEGAWVTAVTAFPALFPPPAPGATPPPPPPPTAPPATPQQPPPTASAAGTPAQPYSPPVKDPAEPVDVGLSTFLSFITAGIWWLIWLYPRLDWSARVAGRPIGNRVTYFWIYVGTVSGAVLFSIVFLPLWFLAAIGAAVIGSLLAYELGKDQETVIRTRSPGTPPPATATTQVVLFATASGTAVTIVLLPVSLILAVFYTVFFFRNHNAVSALVTAGDGGQASTQ